ncbi:MAG: release factor glutamine methyltransferase [Mariniblastus sp.]|jgi:release factor glutamine methyltransferase
MNKRLGIAILAIGVSIAGFSKIQTWNQRKIVEPGSPVEQMDPTSVDSFSIRAWMSIDDLDETLAILETVFWDPRDSISLRKFIRKSDVLRGKSVLEIGTGSGLLSLCSLKAGARNVVATDVNPAAVRNAVFNSERLGLSEALEVRLVPLDNTSAYSVIGPHEKFDVIISNPPWVNQTPKTIDEYALYDTNFALITSLLDELPAHLNPGGTVLLAYGCVDAINTLKRETSERGMFLTVHDTRKLDELPEEFLPGMLLEIRLTE